MLQDLEPTPPDPILGMIVAYREDPNPDKIDLGAGVYRDAAGNTPVLEAVRLAEERVLADQTTKTYVPPPGDPAFIDGIRDLLLGSAHPVVGAARVGGVQAPGGSGALRLLSELVRVVDPQATVWVPDPSWGNHIPLIGGTGLAMEQFPYYDRATHEIDEGAMLSSLAERGPADVVVLHGCCHNPCGADLTPAQWDAVAELATERGFAVLIDIAYHGLAEGLEPDAYGPRTLAEALPELMIAYSCSKNFGLYRERAGVAYVLGDRAKAAQAQLNSIARKLYSMPPAHGASIVAELLADEGLTKSWRDELEGMRDRINGLRAMLAGRLAAKGAPEFEFIARERGMFSFLGFTPEQCAQLRTEHSVYLLDSSRINVAGVNEGNVDRLADAIVTVRDA